MSLNAQAGLRVVPFAGEFRIEDGSGALVGSGASDDARFRALERILIKGGHDMDSIGFVWATRTEADTALRLARR